MNGTPCKAARAAMHQEVLKINAERESLRLEKEILEEQKLRKRSNKSEKSMNILKDKKKRDKELISDESETTEDSDIASVRHSQTLTDQVKKNAIRTLKDWSLKFEGDVEKASDFLEKLRDCHDRHDRLRAYFSIIKTCFICHTGQTSGFVV